MDAQIPSQIISNESQTTTPPPEAEIVASAPVTQTIIPATMGNLRHPAPTNFLVLAPVQSATYSTLAATEAAPSSTEPQNEQSEAVIVPTPEDAAPVQEPTPKQRRSSSIGSEGGQNRFLRLNPTFAGEKFDDFAEMEE